MPSYRGESICWLLLSDHYSDRTELWSVNVTRLFLDVTVHGTEILFGLVN